MKRKYISLAAVFVMLCMTVKVFAQTSDPKPMTSSGTLALLASINGFGPFAVSGPSGNGSSDPRIIEGFGLRYYFADKWAIRGLVSIGHQTGVILNTGESGLIDTGATTLIGLGAAVEYHLHEVYSTDIYVSAGAGIKMNTFTNQGTAKQAQAAIQTVDLSAFGITAAAGFDWYPWNGIAIGAEYTLGWVTTSGTVTLVSGSKSDSPLGSGVGLSGGANVHLVVAF